MQVIKYTINDKQVAQISSDKIIVSSSDEALDLLGNMYYQGVEKIILHQKNISPEFFNLRNGMAGEILQKFSNYRMRLAIIGDFSGLDSKSLKDFIFESNKNKHVNFVGSFDEAISVLG